MQMYKDRDVSPNHPDSINHNSCNTTTYKNNYRNSLHFPVINMKFFTLAALLLPAMSLAMPSAVVERRDTDPSTADIENYISVSENTVDKLTIFGCNIKGG